MSFFDQLSNDSMFHVRKAFAMCCKELSRALSVQQNEQFIVSTRVSSTVCTVHGCLF